MLQTLRPSRVLPFADPGNQCYEAETGFALTPTAQSKIIYTISIPVFNISSTKESLSGVKSLFL
jgi:hypothetical protein